MKAANRIQRRYACYRARCLGRRLRRNRLNREALDAARDAASRRIGHFVRRRLFVRLLEKRFDACKRRLDRERLYRRYVVEAREERNEAERATEGAVETLQLVKLSAWKLGNSGGQNYYYNWVTGESSYERPEGWTPSVGDVWIKNLDERGNVFYFNQLTQESAWFPPCSRCSAEAKRVCFDCGHIHFCKECFEKEHVGLDHEWRGADVEKDKLEKGEKHCIACETKKATLVCKVCRPDAYCAACFATSHAHGRLREHETIPFEVARKGWQQVDGRVDGEPTYYFHVTTGESSHEKPEELMLKDELMEHQKFKEFEKSANEHCAQVDKLQVEIERLQYEKDTTMYTIAKEREAEHAELEELRQVLVRDQEDYHHNRKHLLLKNPIRYYAARMERRRRRRQLYRKMLLLNRQQRGETGGV